MSGGMILKTHSRQAGENARRRKGEQLNQAGFASFICPLHNPPKIAMG
jgi:hypothetical protein